MDDVTNRRRLERQGQRNMAKGKLFQYAVPHHPKPESKDALEPKSAVLVDPTTVMAGSESEVALLAARAVPDTHLDKLDEVEIVVRPF